MFTHKNLHCKALIIFFLIIHGIEQLIFFLLCLWFLRRRYYGVILHHLIYARVRTRMNVSDIWLVVFFLFLPFLFHERVKKKSKRYSRNDCTHLLLIALSWRREGNNNSNKAHTIQKASISVEREKRSRQKITTRRLCNIVRSSKQSCFVMSLPLSWAANPFQSRSVIYCDFYCHLSHIFLFCSRARLMTLYFCGMWREQNVVAATWRLLNSNDDAKGNFGD